jgi:glutamine synthetase
LRVPAGAGKSRHFEHRVAGVDANPYLVAAVTLGAALDGIAAQTNPGLAVTGSAYDLPKNPKLPRNWEDAIDALQQSDFARRILGDMLHTGFVAIKRAEVQRMAGHVSAAEWALYGFVV